MPAHLPAAEPVLLALDPGTGKVGYCTFDAAGRPLTRGVVPLADIGTLLERYPTLPIACGDGTTTLVLPADRTVHRVPEGNSTAEGRNRWRTSHPVLALFELFGYSPNCDGYAAEVIGERYLASQV